MGGRLRSRCGDPAVLDSPEAITRAAPRTGTSACTPGHRVEPSNVRMANAMAASPIQPAADLSWTGSRASLVADNARSAPTPSSQKRVLDTKNARSGAAYD